MKKELSTIGILDSFKPLITILLAVNLFVVATYLLFSWNPPSNKVIIHIEKTAKGYNTYYEDGTLQYEFTKQNTDSLSLETLEMIYEGE